MEEKFRPASGGDFVLKKAPQKRGNICEKSGLNRLLSIIEQDPSKGCQKSDI